VDVQRGPVAASSAIGSRLHHIRTPVTKENVIGPARRTVNAENDGPNGGQEAESKHARPHRHRALEKNNDDDPPRDNNTNIFAQLS